MASCCAPAGGGAPGSNPRKPRGRKLVSGGVTGACECSSGARCDCQVCHCLGCPCKPERVLTAALSRAGDPETLNDLVSKHWGRLNAVHVCAALRSLASTTTTTTRGDDDRDRESPALEKLLCALRARAKEMSPRALSTSAWTLAMLSPSSADLATVAPTLSSAIVTRVAAGSLPPRDVSQILWSYATLGEAKLPTTKA